ncbi:MAG: hypothetical protein ACP6IS_01925 [Candidatus Asgardarchaeia archaeon]
MNEQIVREYEKLAYDDYNELFKLVKKVVKHSINRERASMMLALAYLDLNIGAFHQVGTNVMVLNKLIIEGIEQVSKDKDKKKAYVFVLLLHEYLHAVGFINESDVRQLTYAISQKYFGLEHYVTKFSLHGPYTVFNGLKEAIYRLITTKRMDNKVEFIGNFDDGNANYFM